MRSVSLIVCVSAALAQDGGELFERKIRPVLAEKCESCHSGKLKAPMGGLRADTAAGLRKGGDSGPAIVPGDAANSRLLRAISYSSLDLKMPPAGKLPAEVIDDFRRWIELGAPDPRQDATPAPAAKAVDFDAARRYWAFQPVRRPPGENHSVDSFLLEKLAAKGLRFAPPAERIDWIRRVTFDLTGLPPTPAEIDAYAADASPGADESVVSRLLRSPHYGERQARHWLDLMRFAETNGHEFDNDKLDAWRYRDYVIRAFSRDVPYDRFIREHIVGDLIAEQRATPDGAFLESPLGTSAFWFGEVLNSATDSVKSRADAVDNQIDVFGKAVLGLTVGCARCHDHKFDPIPTADYYGLAGILHSTNIREAVIDSPARAREIQAGVEKIAAVNERISAQLPPASPAAPAPVALREGDVLFEGFEGSSFGEWMVSGAAFGAGPARRVPPNQPLGGYASEGIANSFGPGSGRLTGSLTSKKFKMPKLWVHIRLAGTKRPPGVKPDASVRVTLVADDHKSQNWLPSGNPALEWKTMRMTKEIGRTCYFEIVDRSPDGHLAVDAIVISDHKEPPSTAPAPSPGPAVREELASDNAAIAALRQERAAIERDLPESAFGMVAHDESIGDVRLHIRGKHDNLGDPVPRHFLTIVAGREQPPVTRGSGRLELADRMASPDNPLTARVMVNRIWKQHFGHGLVRTTDNFGKTGEPPSHPELLDWLASEFIRGGWSVKHMHRLMTLSRAYRMSSAQDAAAGRADPRNDLMHRMPVRRLEAEAIRDAILSVTGSLDPTPFGPSVMPHIGKYQDGRGKPQSGPLDGNGRRSIYVQVRRNFITPMFLTFDYPPPISAIGSRGSSTVPLQALMMLNNEFVVESAKRWADRTAGTGSGAGRVESLYRAAFARPPENKETAAALEFVQQGGETAWAGLCHVLLNSAEFLYVR